MKSFTVNVTTEVHVLAEDSGDAIDTAEAFIARATDATPMTLADDTQITDASVSHSEVL